MTILQVPSSFGLVFETVIFSDEYPCFVSGASATIDSNFINDAILKSIQEAEYNLLLALRYPDKTPIDPTTVTTPTEHGKVYHFKENADKLRWLLAGKTSLNDGVKITNLDAFYRQLRLVTVDLSDKTSGLKVARVFSPYLVPINFGFNSAHYTHSAIISPESLKIPHYFA